MASADELHVGDQIQTVFGTGHLISIKNDGKCVCTLNKWIEAKITYEPWLIVERNKVAKLIPSASAKDLTLPEVSPEDQSLAIEAFAHDYQLSTAASADGMLRLSVESEASPLEDEVVKYPPSTKSPDDEYTNYIPVIQSRDINIGSLSLSDFGKLKRTHPNVSDENIAIFLLARKGDYHQAGAMLDKHLAWKATVPRITKADVAKEFATGKLYRHGFDRQGHPLLVYTARNHVPGESSPQDTMRLIIWVIEECVRTMPPTHTKFTLLLNRAGATFANFDQSFIKDNSGVIQVRLTE